jgi:cytochrome c oxidase subunit IV
MKRLLTAVLKLVRDLSQAVVRFPWTVFCLGCSTGIACYLISLQGSADLIIEKLMFMFLLGAFIGVTAQFAAERFPRLDQRRRTVYGLAILLTGGYYLIIAPAAAIDYGVGARTMVAVFSMFCAFIWLPAAKGVFDFNQVALVHFKAAFTAILYAGVLTAGLASIIGAVDILLFSVHSDCYGYMLALVWILFAPSYYLSLLPRFNSCQKADRAYTEQASGYPRFLEILISYIAIPLVAAYTLVLVAYFVKIGLSRNWPSGQLGPMILAYSSAGLILYVLASGLQDRLAVLYQLLFPKVLVPIVLMQLVSVFIRVRAYGITESRYYLVLFGLFSLIIGVVLSLWPVEKNSLIALLAAGFAVVSVLPPVDAFTLARTSQVERLEQYLVQGNILVAGKLEPNPDADLDLRIEATNILYYLQRRGYVEAIDWLPAEFEVYRDMETVLGFQPTYPQRGERKYTYVSLDSEQPVSIKGYDLLLEAGIYVSKGTTEAAVHDLNIDETGYRLQLKPIPNQELEVALLDAQGGELVTARLYDFAAQAAAGSDGKALAAADLTLEAEEDGYRLGVVFQHISLTTGNEAEPSADYQLYLLVGIPRNNNH